jgi:hypothetical protein
MLTAKLNKNGRIELEDKKSTVELDGKTVILNGQHYESPGEYEAGGVEIIYGESAALIVWERLQIAYVFRISEPTDFEKAQFSSSDVVIFGSEDKLDRKIGTDILDQYDPKVLIIGHATEIEDGGKERLKTQEVTSVKISAATLPEEGRDSYLLV